MSDGRPAGLAPCRLGEESSRSHLPAAAGRIDGRSSPKRSYLEGARAVLPLAVAIAAFGMYFGVLARSVGMSPWAAIVMSATTFAGSAQFAAVSVLASGGGAVVAVIAGSLLNARYGLMGLSAARALVGPVWSRLLVAQLVVDETWAVAHRTDGTIDRDRLIGAALVLYAAHVTSTAIGALWIGGVADPTPWGSMRPFLRCSSFCSGHSSVGRGRRWRRF